MHSAVTNATFAAALSDEKAHRFAAALSDKKAEPYYYVFQSRQEKRFLSFFRMSI